uniref:Uncharacterized protein n=1 Tax=Arundo donax TaxID=35708 RepID=A0A0A8Y3C7_ARUDO
MSFEANMLFGTRDCRSDKSIRVFLHVLIM